MKKIIQNKAYLLILLIFMVSCNPKILNYADPSTFNIVNYFNTPAEIQQGSTAIYAGFYLNQMMGFQWSEMFDNLADESDPTPNSLSNEIDVPIFHFYTYNNTSLCIQHLWTMLYRIILRSNLVIEKAQAYINSNGDDANHIASMSLGEAYFLRGYAYSQLAFYWGAVPLRTTFNQSNNVDAPRTPVANIWAVAENDFITAQKLLPASWNAANVGRATSGAATAFLGKLYLFNKRYTDADAQFATLTSYSLLPGAKWEDNFGETNKNNQESIFEVQFSPSPGEYLFGVFSSTEGNVVPSTQNTLQLLYGFNDWGNWKFQPLRVNDFSYNDENGVSYIDPRAQLTFYGGIGDTTWLSQYTGGPQHYDFATYGYQFKKYQNKEYIPNEPITGSGNDIRLMRYADVLLMRAECALNNNNIPGCISFINQVRTRVGAFPYTKSYDSADAMNLLIRERQLELYGEQHRFDDLKRWGLLVPVMNVDMVTLFGSPRVTAKDTLFPIPLLEIDTNLGLGPVNNDWN